jgi:photosystem II cytochrome c550
MKMINRWKIFTNALAIGFMVLLLGWGDMSMGRTAIAAPDPYISQYLKVLRGESADMRMDAAGTVKQFGYDALLEGKELFGQNCLSCHVGGTTLSSPSVSLALAKLQGATPPLDNVNALMGFMRHPVAYDGSDENYACREVATDWIPDEQVEKMAAFLLRAAEYAKGWGTSQF